MYIAHQAAFTRHMHCLQLQCFHYDMLTLFQGHVIGQSNVSM